MSVVYLKRSEADSTVWIFCNEGEKGAVKFEATSKLVWELGLALMQCQRLLVALDRQFHWEKTGLPQEIIDFINETKTTVDDAVKMIEEDSDGQAH